MPGLVSRSRIRNKLSPNVIDLSRIPKGAVTRFAPSPTGRLHLGHVANAAWTWGIAAAVQGRVVLRIEDHDRGRCRPEFERAILDDLDWLGLAPESISRASLAAGTVSPFRQSDNEARYLESLGRLRVATSVYGCRCSRRQIADRVGPVGSGVERRYPGTCRHAGIAESAGVGLRAVLPAGPIGFDDIRHGPVEQVPAQQCGDLLIRDSHGNWTYQFAVVVDDLVQGIDLIIRGDDLLASTGRQIALATLLGSTTRPVFLHHPLILADSGAKLSKRDGAPGLDDLRAAGHSAAQVLGMAAAATGLVPAGTRIESRDLGALFS